jgi:nucleotide-binding universal stress UspA family protein
MSTSGPIFVATDLSPGSDHAIRQGHARALAQNVPLVVGHVVPEVLAASPTLPGDMVGAELAAAWQPTALHQAVAARVTAVTGREPGAFEVVIAHGSPAATIVAQAEARGASLVIVGGVGRGGLARALIGTTAERVVRHAHGPVLVARPGPDHGGVVVGTDLSDPAVPAIVAGAAESHALHVPLLVIHAAELALAAVLEGYPVALSPEVEAQAVEKAKARLLAALVDHGIPVETGRVEVGEAARVLLTAAETTPARLMVIGTHGKTGWRRVLLGSVAERVMRHAPCSVLVVRLAT